MKNVLRIPTNLHRAINGFAVATVFMLMGGCASGIEVALVNNTSYPCRLQMGQTPHPIRVDGIWFGRIAPEKHSYFTIATPKVTWLYRWKYPQAVNDADIIGYAFQVQPDGRIYQLDGYISDIHRITTPPPQCGPGLPMVPLARLAPGKGNPLGVPKGR